VLLWVRRKFFTEAIALSQIDGGGGRNFDGQSKRANSNTDIEIS
jgi:hypothetical protein